MIAPIFQHPNPSPALQDAMRDTMIHLNIKDGLSDSKGIPFPLSGGVIYDDNVMKVVQYVSDEGFVVYSDKGPLARDIADKLGYVSASNCTAAIRSCVQNDLIKASIVDGNGCLTRTEYGLCQLERWEENQEYYSDNKTEALT